MKGIQGNIDFQIPFIPFIPVKLFFLSRDKKAPLLLKEGWPSLRGRGGKSTDRSELLSSLSTDLPPERNHPRAIGVVLLMKTESPKLLARLAGVFFLLTILGGVIAQGFISDSLINYSDAAATANNILANRGLFQAGFTIFLIEMACQLITTVLMYRLLRPVNRTLALLMLSFELMAITIKTFARVFFIGPLWLLEHGNALAGFGPDQLQSLALVLLRINDIGAATAIAFFGFSGLPMGYLTYRSGYFPRWLGVIGMLAGLGWLTFIYPSFGRPLFIYIALFAPAASVAKIFWLIVFGVDEEKFRAVEGTSN